MFEKLTENETLGKMVTAGAKVAGWGFIILGGMLIVQKVLNLTWNFSVSIGL